MEQYRIFAQFRISEVGSNARRSIALVADVERVDAVVGCTDKVHGVQVPEAVAFERNRRAAAVSYRCYVVAHHVVLGQMREVERDIGFRTCYIM